MRTWGIGTVSLCLILCGCSTGETIGPESGTAGDDTPVQSQTEQVPNRAEETVGSGKDGAEENDGAAAADLQVDDILTQGESYLGKQVAVQGQTPQSAIGDENGIPIGFYYQTGKPLDQDHRIRIEIPEDTPGMSLVTVSGILERDQSGFILRKTRTEAVHQSCESLEDCTNSNE